jgi:hypothetical protein
MAPASIDDVVAAVEPLSSMLSSDGYALEVSAEEDVIRFHVVAAPEACADCLVPESVFASVLKTQLEHRGLTPEFELVYPDALDEDVSPTG